MSTEIELSGLYRGVINLWVEDAITREYLSTIWEGDPNFLFLVGGGIDGVAAVVKDARTNGYENVFGFIDRDFRPSNRDCWLDLARNPSVFIPTVHEVENFLLDPRALAGCDVNNLGRSEGEILGMLEARARDLCWWMACREVVANYARQFRNEFIGHPPARIADAADAEAHICDSPWFSSFAGKVVNVTRAEANRLLQDAHSRARDQISSGDWKIEFSGKELFRDIRSRIYDSSHRPASSSVLDSDVALSMAQWQTANDLVPPELIELRTALRMRSGL